MKIVLLLSILISFLVTGTSAFADVSDKVNPAEANSNPVFSEYSSAGDSEKAETAGQPGVSNFAPGECAYCKAHLIQEGVNRVKGKPDEVAGTSTGEVPAARKGTK